MRDTRASANKSTGTDTGTSTGTSTSTGMDAGAGDAYAGNPAVRRATGPRYAGGDGTLGRRASETGDPLYHRRARGADGSVPPSPPRRDKVHSILTALPVLMLVAGLWIFYRGEGAQNAGAPIAAESVSIEASFVGLSKVSSGGEGRHYLWYDTDGVKHGARVRATAVQRLRDALEPGERLSLDVAPTVAGSSTRWLWRLRAGDGLLVDESDRLAR